METFHAAAALKFWQEALGSNARPGAWKVKYTERLLERFLDLLEGFVRIHGKPDDTIAVVREKYQK